MIKHPKPLPPSAYLSEPKVEIQLKARQDGSHWWRVGVYASKRRLVGAAWCEQISWGDVDSKVENVPFRISVLAGAIAERQAEMYGSTFDPREIAILAVEVYHDLVADLEKKHGHRVPRMSLRSDDR